MGSVKVVILHWASQPWRVMWPASLRTVEDGKEASAHDVGSPGVGEKSADSSESLRPPSLSLSKRRKRSTKNR